MSVRKSISPSIASVLARRCRRSTAIEAGSTTWLSIPLASAMEPEAVEARLLNDDHLNRHPTAPLSRCSQPAEKVEQRATIAADHHMLRQLLTAGCAYRHEPP
jgi:hypothetical protein